MTNPIEILKGMQKNNEEILNTPFDKVEVAYLASQNKNVDYDTRICQCGTIHFVDNKLIDSCITSNKELILICGGCGVSKTIGADEDSNYLQPGIEEPCYSMYTVEFDKSFTTNEEGDIILDNGSKSPTKSIIRYSKGKIPVMKTGYKAGYYTGDRFVDNESVASSFLDSKEEIKTYDENRKIIDMQSLLRDFTEDELNSLSKYLISGFDWSNTKYMKSYHS